jgi:hypothetical protein
MSLGKALVIVYNLDSGVLPKIKDFSSRESVPGIDGCKLFFLTNSPVGMKKEWKRFIRELGIPARFLNRNEFISEFGTDLMTFPVILVQTGKGQSLVISTEEINQCMTLEDLISLIQSRFANIR